MLASAAGKQPITGADVLKIRNVTSVAVASDGSFAVYGVQSIHTEPPADPKGEAGLQIPHHTCGASTSTTPTRSPSN